MRVVGSLLVGLVALSRLMELLHFEVSTWWSVFRCGVYILIYLPALPAFASCGWIDQLRSVRVSTSTTLFFLVSFLPMQWEWRGLSD